MVKIIFDNDSVIKYNINIDKKVRKKWKKQLLLYHYHL